MHCVSSFMNDYWTSICLFLSTKPDEQTVLKKSIKILNYYNMTIFPFFVGIINSFSGKLTACYSMISSNFRQFKGGLGTRHCFEWYWCWKLEFRSNIYWAEIKKKKKVVRCIITFLKMFTALNTWDLVDITYMEYDSLQARI